MRSVNETVYEDCFRVAVVGGGCGCLPFVREVLLRARGCTEDDDDDEVDEDDDTVGCFVSA